MDLIINTWTTNDPAPLTMLLFVASLLVAIVGIACSVGLYTKTSRPRKIAALTLGLATAAAVAIMLPIGFSAPRVDNPASASYIEASGTVDTVTPALNRGGTGIRLTDTPEILLAINEDEADNFAGLEGQPTTLYCKPPGDLDQDDPALAAGTILDCASTPTQIRNSGLDELFPPDVPGSAQTTTTAIAIVGDTDQ